MENTITTQLPERNSYFDIVKAFAIICVILGHSIQYGSGDNYLQNMLFFDNPVFAFIYSFHMPLFMLVSGYFYSKSVRKHSFNKEVVRLLQANVFPILLWTAVPLAVNLIRMQKAGAMLREALSMQLLVDMALSNLWFLWAIFWNSLVILLVRTFFKDSKWIYLLIFVLTFITPDRYFFHLYKYMYPYYLTGYFCGKQRHIAVLKRYIVKTSSIMICGGVFLLLLLFFNWESYIYTTGYSILQKDVSRQLLIDLYRFAVGFAGSAFILLFIRKLSPYLTGEPLNAVLLIGRNTLGIYIVSDYIFRFLLPLVTGKLININYCLTIVETALILMISLGGVLLIRKNPIVSRLLLGR